MSNVFNELTVVKRSGQRVEFNGPKIAVAIKSSFDEVGLYDQKDVNKVYFGTLKYIEENYTDRKTINVEDIQDIIEMILKEYKYIDVYKAFSDYRIRRAESRKAFSEKQQHKFVKAIEKVGIINSKEELPDRLLYKFGTTISNEYTKSYVLDNKYVRAHEEGKIYIHDLAYFNLGYLPNVHLILDNVLKDENSFYDLLTTLIEAKKEVSGYVAIDAIDNLLSTFVLKKFKKEFKETIHSYLNITGFLGFINQKKLEDIIEKELSVSSNLEIFDSIFINEQLKLILKNAYDDTKNKLNEFLSLNIRKLLEVLNKANTKKESYTVSLGTSKTKEAELIKNIFINEINNLPRLNNVTVILKISKNSTLEYLDEISNLVLNDKNIKICYVGASYNKQEISEVEYFSNGLRIYRSSDNQKGSTGRANIANVSINMARLGLKHKVLNDNFYKELDELLELSKNALVVMFENIGDKTTINYDVLFKQNILDDEKLEPGQKIRKVIKNGTLNFNLIGLMECAIKIDKQDFENIVFKIVNHISNKVEEYEKNTKFNFTLSLVEEKTASKKLLDLDKAVYGITPEITKKDRYSTFNFINSDFDKTLELTGKLGKVLTGGNALKISLPKNTSIKKINNILTSIIENDIGFAVVKVKGDSK